MHSIAEFLERLNKLTQQNLEILKSLNDSFFTKKEHLVVNVDNNQYVIPSFISLENKVNALQEGLNNLVNAPLTGEAYFNYDGNSKTIQVRGFNNTPNAITLKTDDTNNFFVEDTSIFKDFITPNAHLKFNLVTLPDDINTVIVKKISPISSNAKDILKSYLRVNEEAGITDTATSVAYKDLYKQLTLLNKGVDYEEYDTIRQLPIRQSLGTGTYVITKIIKDTILSDLTEQLVLEISNQTPLKYKKFDETIDIYLESGEYLTTYDDRVKLQIVDINTTSHQLTLNIVNGDYLDLFGYTGEVDPNDLSNVPDMSKLRFFSVNDFSKDKYIDVTLEEDQYIAVFVAPLNSRMNIQAPWGNGVVINSYGIKYAEDNNTSYKNYYDANVRNIGDILKEIVSITNSSITKYSKGEFDEFTTYKPVIDPSNLNVVQINRHLNNSPTIQKIRSLYSQKKQYEIDLNEIQSKITDINTTLSSVSFDDTTNIRTLYESQLSEFTKKKSEIVNAINNTINEISLAVNESEVPIEDSKYRIRGYYDWSNKTDEVLQMFGDHIKSIRVEYRYKNKDQMTGTAESFQNGKFLYSDWNRMYSFDRKIKPHFDGDRYRFNYESNNDDKNEPSFNQIDIPITQGESVDIRLKIVWDFGSPYIETTSDWSGITNIEFPEEYLKDIQITTIIEENNSDIETNRFNNILIDQGIKQHIDDKQIDQDIIYYHRPEHISSGFYTDERRIIPLKDKLSTMSASIVNLEDTVFGSNSDNISVEFIYDSTSTSILPYQDNVVNVNAEVLTTSPTSTTPTNLDEFNNIANLKITNNSSHTVRLFSIFPGNRNTTFTKPTDTTNYKNYNICVLCNAEFSTTQSNENYLDTSNLYKYNAQVKNQFIYLRATDAFDNSKSLNIHSNSKPLCTALLNTGMNQLCIDSNNIRDYKVINPGESILIPILFCFIYKNGNQWYNYTTNSKISDLELSIDLRTSLYTDPQNYYLKIHRVEPDDVKLHDKIIESQKNLTKYNSVVAKIFEPSKQHISLKTKSK